MKRITLLIVALLQPGISPATQNDPLAMKLDYAERTIVNSATAQRIGNSNNAEAKALLEKAHALYQQAREAETRGAADSAEKLVTEALRVMVAAAQMVPDHNNQAEQDKKRYTELLQQTETYLSWSQETTNTNYTSPAPAQVEEDIAQAKALAADGRMNEASKLLSGVLNRLVTAESKSLSERTITYQLKFANAAEEYRHELGRNNEFERLIPLAATQHNPALSARTLMNTYVERALTLRREAETLFDNARHDEAITSLQKSTAEFQRALRIVGVQ